VPRVLKQKLKAKAFKIHKADWELWIFVAALVTIFGFFAQTRGQIDTSDAGRRLQSTGDLYDIRVPNNNRMIHDRLETGR
jgi:hypothetical protein